MGHRITPPSRHPWVLYGLGVVWLCTAMAYAHDLLAATPRPQCLVYLFATRADTSFYEVHCVKPAVLTQESH